MNKLFPLICALLVLAGCATSANYQKNLNAWVGEDESALVAKWGKPNKTYEVDGFTYLVYNTSGEASSPGINTDSQSTVAGANGWIPSLTFWSTCQTTFEIQKGKVVTFEFKGADCRSSTK
jgi:Tfp pilus assembly protein PilP